MDDEDDCFSHVKRLKPDQTLSKKSVHQQSLEKFSSSQQSTPTSSKKNSKE